MWRISLLFLAFAVHTAYLALLSKSHILWLEALWLSKRIRFLSNYQDLSYHTPNFINVLF